MNIIWKDRVRQAITTGGTGNIVLGAPVISSQILDSGDENGLIFYLIIDKDGSWETGSGQYTHLTKTFSRDTIYDSSLGGARLNVQTTAYFELTENSGSAGSTPSGITTSTILGTNTLPVIVVSSIDITAKWIITIESAGQVRLLEVTALYKSLNPIFTIINDIGDRISVTINVVDVSGKLALNLVNTSGSDMIVHIASTQLIA